MLAIPNGRPELKVPGVFYCYFLHLLQCLLIYAIELASQFTNLFENLK